MIGFFLFADALGVNERLYFLSLLDQFDDLHRTGSFMRNDLAPPRPCIGIIVVPDIGEQHILTITPHDDANVLADARGPNVFVSYIEALEAESWPARIDHQVDRSDFDLFLLSMAELDKTIGESGGVEEGHKLSRP